MSSSSTVAGQGARRKSDIPRPPPSPLRIPSPTPSNSTTPNTPHASIAQRLMSPPPSTPSTPPPGPGSSITQKTRARDLLRKHYGLGVGPPPTLPGKSPDPMNLDSNAFDAKAYYEQLITTSSLSTLLKRENDLMTEIRELDSERQSLVYNHHHELIAASDTIGAMKTRADGLEGDLDLLRAAFSEISRLASEVTVEESSS